MRSVMDGPVAHTDRISALPDDLLHEILSFLGDARDVTRTAVLSRRWRHVWIHAKNLSFDDRHLNRPIAWPGFRRFRGYQLVAGFVDWALAQRGDADMDSLRIDIAKQGEVLTQSISKWLRYATQHVVTSVIVHLTACAMQQMADVVLPIHGRMRSISLAFSKHRLQLPSVAAARYEALTQLSLKSLSFTGNTTLGDFVSSCCPRLRRLHIDQPKGLLQLVLRSEALEDIEIVWACHLRTLDVTAPNLRVVRLESCFQYPRADDNKVATIVAPRLQELGISFLHQGPRPDLDIHDLASVRRLDDLQLDMHGKYCCDSGVGLSLLAKCPGVEHVDVSLDHSRVDDNGGLFDITTEGVAAQFSKVRSMVIWTYSFPERHLVASIASVLSRCSCLTSLWLGIGDKRSGPRYCFCDDLEDEQVKIALEMMEDVIITGFTGGDEEMQLVSLLFESSNSIKCMALSETKNKIDITALTLKIGKEVDSNNTILQKLMKMPCTDRGHWHFVEQVFVWT